MNEAVILSACRTPIGKFQGALAAVSAPQLGSLAVRAAIERSGIRSDQIDEVILGNVVAAGVGQAPARQAAIGAGIPSSVAALTINKVCGSGLKAIMLAAQAIRAGDAEVVVAGGFESMSRSPFLADRVGTPFGDRSLADSLLHDGLLCPFSNRSMGQIAESLAQTDQITRTQQDEYAKESHRRAIAAIERGVFQSEIIPVSVHQRAGERVVDRDEGPRADATLERLGQLQPSFVDGGTVTAGNSSMLSDGAAAVVVTSCRFQKAHSLKPLARIVSYVTSGTRPEDLFLAPVSAIQELLRRTCLTTAEIDQFEINEAFAAQMLACLRRLDLSPEKVNVNGGAIALGHPLGASGARVTVSLLHSLRNSGQRRGIAALCLGGGNAVAALLEIL